MALHTNFPKSPHEVPEPGERWFPADEALRETAHERLPPPQLDARRVQRRGAPCPRRAPGPVQVDPGHPPPDAAQGRASVTQEDVTATTKDSDGAIFTKRGADYLQLRVEEWRAGAAGRAADGPDYRLVFGDHQGRFQQRPPQDFPGPVSAFRECQA